MRNSFFWSMPFLLAAFVCAHAVGAETPMEKSGSPEAVPPGVVVVTDHNDSEDASGSFKFRKVATLARDNAGAKAKITVVAGAGDEAGGAVGKLNDGRGPTEEDQPDENFFFGAGSKGGRLQLDLGSVIEIRRVSTYSWHAGSRAPQVYELYASDGAGSDFAAIPAKAVTLTKQGWKLLAKVDTRPDDGEAGGQYGVSILATNSVLGKYRYLLLDCHCTDEKDPFSNTFFSEINVIDANASTAAEAPVASMSANTEATRKTFEAAGGKYHIIMDATSSPELAGWAFETMAPIAQEWYPKLIEMLPSEGFKAPTTVMIRFRDNISGGTPAYTSGNRITLNAAWFAKNLKGEAAGAVVHEMVHVVQQYWSRGNSVSVPGWLVEGIPDYLRFFKYEPQHHGADDVWLKHQRTSSIRYDGMYRFSANFLNWVSEKYDPNIVEKINAAARQGRYNGDLWQTATQKSVQELGAEWLEAKKQEFGIATPAATNSAAATSK